MHVKIHQQVTRFAIRKNKNLTPSQVDIFFYRMLQDRLANRHLKIRGDAI